MWQFITLTWVGQNQWRAWEFRYLKATNNIITTVGKRNGKNLKCFLNFLEYFGSSDSLKMIFQEGRKKNVRNINFTKNVNVSVEEF